MRQMGGEGACWGFMVGALGVGEWRGRRAVLGPNNIILGD